MFEKEAEEYAIDNYETCTYDVLPYHDDSRVIEQAFKVGANLGYSKANEWHKPSEKLPEENSLVLALLFNETEPTICKYVVSNQWECLPKRIVFCSNEQVRKWKEIILPMEIEQ